MAKSICRVESCGHPIKGHGYCDTHYQRWRRLGDALAEVRITQTNLGKECSVDNCDRPAKTRGWCPLHYKRWLINGSTDDPPAPVERFCSAEDCGRPHEGRGLCSKHRERQRAEERRPASEVVLDLPGERWLPVPGYRGIYEVSDRGRVRSLDRDLRDSNGVTHTLRGRLTRPTPMSSGHLTVDLTYPGKVRKRHLVHRLVLATFVGPAPDGMEGCHNDGNPANNNVGNLRWGSRSSNMYDKRGHGTDHQANKIRCPRRHRLAPPNIKASAARLGRRSCLACDRAQANQRYALSQGHAFDFDAVVARHYAEIMGVDNDGECPNGGFVAS